MVNNIKVTKINDVEYVNKYHYDKILKKKTPKAEKLLKEKYCDKDFCITDPSNVCAILPIRHIGDDKKVIETYFGEYMEVESPKITYFHDEKWDIDSLTIEETTLTKKYLDDMKDFAKVWFSGWEKPRVFMKMDKKWGFIKDQPVIFVFGNKLAFVLAPRITND